MLVSHITDQITDQWELLSSDQWELLSFGSRFHILAFHLKFHLKLYTSDHGTMGVVDMGLDETQILLTEFRTCFKASSRLLVTVYIKFHPYETVLFSFLINYIPCHSFEYVACYLMTMKLI